MENGIKSLLFAAKSFWKSHILEDFNKLMENMDYEKLCLDFKIFVLR